MMERKLLLSGIIVSLFLGIMVFIDSEILPRFEIERPLSTSGNFYDGDFVLSEAPGFHDEEFYLTVSIPSIPRATIYWTIDGTEPQPGEANFITRGERDIQVSGRLDGSSQIFVADRTTDWRNAILMYHSEEWFWDREDRPREGISPVDDIDILQGTAFRFRGFIRGVPVTDTITATYIVESDAVTRFNGMPIVAITAPYEDFLALYGNTCRTNMYRRVFNYEYFSYSENIYMRRFSMLGSSNLGGGYSRSNEQRTINVNFSRGELNGVIMYPIFDNVNELYLMRLWNGGSVWRRHHFPDTLTQTVSSDLNVLFSNHQLAIKFINGEFWGFTNIREHTSNEDFIAEHTDLERGNILVTNRRIEGGDLVQEGDEELGELLFLQELTIFTTEADMSTDEARERLFNEFFDQDNFMDYLIVNTFFCNFDWPHNNVRMFRVVTPDPFSNNPYSDGRWRFILHDQDATLRYVEECNNFNRLYERFDQADEGVKGYFLVFNNPAFVREFVNRAEYVLEHYFYVERLVDYHNEFIAEYRPLLVDMYNRFNLRGSIYDSLENFERRDVQDIEHFIQTRGYYYRQQLDHLLRRVGLEP